MGDEAARLILIDQIFENVKNQRHDNGNNDNHMDIFNRIMAEIDNRILNANPNELALLNAVQQRVIAIRDGLVIRMNDDAQAEGGA
jgi:hypothetical protein